MDHYCYLYLVLIHFVSENTTQRMECSAPVMLISKCFGRRVATFLLARIPFLISNKDSSQHTS